MRDVYFHEDDYRQIEILPIDNLSFCIKEIGDIEKSASENFDGFGYKDIHIREENPSELISLSISENELEDKLSAHLPKYDNVYTGYSSYREQCTGTFAFGKDDQETIFYETSNGNCSAIWVSDPLEELLYLPYLEKLLFVDWSWGFVCPLIESKKYLEYINNRSQEIKRRMAEYKASLNQNLPKKPWWKLW